MSSFPRSKAVGEQNYYRYTVKEGLNTHHSQHALGRAVLYPLERKKAKSSLTIMRKKDNFIMAYSQERKKE